MMTLSKQPGFTLIELIMVIILVSILSIYVLPKFDIEFFRQTGFVQQTSATIRYGQKLAITSGCEVDVSITATACNLNWNNPSADTNCPSDNTSIFKPGSTSTDFCEDSSPESTSDLPVNFTFDKIGRPDAAQSFDLGSFTIDVVEETGFTYET